VAGGLLASGRNSQEIRNIHPVASFDVKMWGDADLGEIWTAFYVNIANMHAFDLGPYGMFHWSGVVVAEMVYTCLLCYVVLAVATVKDYGMDTFGLAIGFAIVAGGSLSLSLSLSRARARVLSLSLSLSLARARALCL
jgi:glycerol uptake facilitator-like aquaporin